MTDTTAPETTAPDAARGPATGPDVDSFEAFAAAGNRVCVLFTAKWCAAGVLLQRQLGPDTLDVPLVAVDVETHPHLADRFRIQSLPTAVLLCGNERGRLIGAFGPPQVKALAAQGLATDSADIDTRPSARRAK